MSNNLKISREIIWLVGAGELAFEYHKVLKFLNKNHLVIGRSKKSANNFMKMSNVKVFEGGLTKFLKTSPEIASKAIIAVNIEQLSPVCIELIKYNVKDILIEKPGGINFNEVKKLNKLAREKKINIKVAYNRRYYSSTILAKKLIKRDGGVQNFNFEFTEWTQKISQLRKSEKVLKNWFFANSTHVVDLAFFLGGVPSKLNSFILNKNTWNGSPAVFGGAGKTKEGAVFSYHANWKSAGRWSIELQTAKGKYILCPLEKLFFQKRDSLEKQEIKLNSKFDKNFKPGFYKQIKAFINDTDNGLLSLKEHYSMLSIYRKISSSN